MFKIGDKIYYNDPDFGYDDYGTIIDFKNGWYTAKSDTEEGFTWNFPESDGYVTLVEE